jgi:hypothetical protein
MKHLIIIIACLISCQNNEQVDNDNDLLKEEIKILNQLINLKIKNLDNNAKNDFNREIFYLESIVTKQVADELIKIILIDSTKINNIENKLLDFYFMKNINQLNLTLDLTDTVKYNHIRKILFATNASIELFQNDEQN